MVSGLWGCELEIALNTLTVMTALLLAPLAVLQADESCLPSPLRVQTGLLEGVSNPGQEVVVFNGIPYAAPPVGDLRWRRVDVTWHLFRSFRKASSPSPLDSETQRNLLVKRA